MQTFKVNPYSIVGYNSQRKVTFPVNSLHVHWISNHPGSLETITRISQMGYLTGIIVKSLISGTVVFCVLPVWGSWCILDEAFHFMPEFSPSIWLLFFLQRRSSFQCKISLLYVIQFKTLLRFMPAFSPLLCNRRNSLAFLLPVKPSYTCISHEVAVQGLDMLNFDGVRSIGILAKEKYLQCFCSLAFSASV